MDFAGTKKLIPNVAFRAAGINTSSFVKQSCGLISNKIWRVAGERNPLLDMPETVQNHDIGRSKFEANNIAIVFAPLLEPESFVSIPVIRL